MTMRNPQQPLRYTDVNSSCSIHKLLIKYKKNGGDKNDTRRMMRTPSN